MHPSKIIDQAVKDIIKPFLKDKGFKNKGNKYWIESADFIQSISVVKGSYNDNSQACFWLTLGVYNFEIQKEMDLNYKAFPPVSIDCTISDFLTRISGVINQGWDVYLDSDFKEVGGNVCDLLEKHGLPWFEKSRDPVFIIQYMKKLHYEVRLKRLEKYIQNMEGK